MAVLSSQAHEAKSREKYFQVALSPISSQFLCPRLPLLLRAPNQNRHATQANGVLVRCMYYDTRVYEEISVTTWNDMYTELEIKKIFRSPFGYQPDKYSRQTQIFSRQFVKCK